MVDKDVVIDGYDDVASTYTEGRSLGDEERAALGSFLDSISADSRVLDAGCGGGEPVLRELTSQSQKALGLDFSAAQLGLAASNAPEARLLRGDMTRLPLADGSLDAVLAYHSLIHVPADEHRQSSTSSHESFVPAVGCSSRKDPRSGRGRTRTGWTPAARCSGTSPGPNRPEHSYRPQDFGLEPSTATPRDRPTRGKRAGSSSTRGSNRNNAGRATPRSSRIATRLDLSLEYSH
jgi:SAM-dependent methyltransferase